MACAVEGRNISNRALKLFTLVASPHVHRQHALRRQIEPRRVEMPLHDAREAIGFHVHLEAVPAGQLLQELNVGAALDQRLIVLLTPPLGCVDDRA